jgi:hypothetical protein
MPNSGDGPDALSKPPPGQAFTVPIDDFVLRPHTAIAAKIYKLSQYIEDGTISREDATIVAVSGGRLPFRFTEGPIPSIVRAVLGVGSPVLEINRAARKIVGASIEYRDHVLKKSGCLVDTDVFLRDESAHVSAVLYSSADCVNHPQKPGVTLSWYTTRKRLYPSLIAGCQLAIITGSINPLKSKFQQNGWSSFASTTRDNSRKARLPDK